LCAVLGVAAGVIACVQQLGAAAGLAVLTTLAFRRAASASAGGIPEQAAAVAGYRFAFQAAGLALAAGAVLVLLMTGHTRRPASLWVKARGMDPTALPGSSAYPALRRARRGPRSRAVDLRSGWGRVPMAAWTLARRVTNSGWPTVDRSLGDDMPTGADRHAAPPGLAVGRTASAADNDAAPRPIVGASQGLGCTWAAASHGPRGVGRRSTARDRELTCPTQQPCTRVERPMTTS
jgi:hypothetical protein